MSDFIKGSNWSKYSYNEVQNILLIKRNQNSRNNSLDNKIIKHAQVINIDKQK